MTAWSHLLSLEALSKATQRDAAQPARQRDSEALARAARPPAARTWKAPSLSRAAGTSVGPPRGLQDGVEFTVGHRGRTHDLVALGLIARNGGRRHMRLWPAMFEGAKGVLAVDGN